MSLSLLSPSANGCRLGPVEPRHAPLFCFVLLTVSCALASFALACATPFAAFAVIAAAMLPLRSALLVVTGAWLVNQGIGFGALRYPIDGNTMLWGVVIGIAALAATATSTAVLRLRPQATTRSSWRSLRSAATASMKLRCWQRRRSSAAQTILPPPSLHASEF